MVSRRLPRVLRAKRSAVLWRSGKKILERQAGDGTALRAAVEDWTAVGHSSEPSPCAERPGSSLRSAFTAGALAGSVWEQHSPCLLGGAVRVGAPELPELQGGDPCA